MSASVEELRADLRERALAKRTRVAENLKAPQDMAGLVDELNQVLGQLRAALQARSPTNFVVTERDLNGDVKAFKAE